MHTAAIMRRFGPDPDNWVRPTSADHDVVVVGAGQAGLGIGFALRRAGIGRSTVIDAAAPGETGSWTTTARMHTLRTPKIWPQPEYGYSELSFRAWYERLHGQAAYDLVENIPRTVWAQYVAWFGRTVEVPVRHHTRLVGVAPASDHLVLRLAVTGTDGQAEDRVETTRRLVLATGVEGTGGPALPPYFRALPAHLAAHTGDRIDFTQFRGGNVAVLGAGSSALDAAAVALEAGAQQVHVFTRRSELIVHGPSRNIGRNIGAKENFHRRDDADRWRAQVLAARAGRSCTQESLARAMAFPGFRIHLSAPWRHARADGGKVRVDAADGSHVFDFVVAGTGYQYDPRTRPELAEIAPHIALWGDRYKPPAELAHEGLACVPYLGPGYELVGKEPGSFVGRIHAFSAAAGLSFGIPAGDAQSLATGIPRLVDALGRELFFEDQRHLEPVRAPDGVTLSP
ncbi:NAD(P)/FAD-dependent oxidoreductase [Kribbella albertanoniae]|uniref:NAD(P)/FAD-dependent oxidoreductase n=1 Tax=Kribbella albertanoniae TaxID=1266829 RepID=A0A4V2XSF9_9ACTN|nr:NAD(P)/FAD-dependent oxidoreductase [Kribbella albertanoniae]TDC33645.1 NAD(P)/FAD-dependent oxidoreductase [Kribbella albertanoniae]